MEDILSEDFRKITVKEYVPIKIQNTWYQRIPGKFIRRNSLSLNQFHILTISVDDVGIISSTLFPIGGISFNYKRNPKTGAKFI